MTPPNTSKVPVGTVLADKFRITQEIGRGGMAAVYEAENVQIGKRVAVKILAAELVRSKVVTGRFIREARAMAAIDSPYICEVYDSGEFDDRPFMVLELLQGESLYDLLSRIRRLDPDLTLKIATHCALGLLKAHEIDVVHRDLKPENIFLTKNEDGGITAKLLDFGLAKFYDNSTDKEQIRLTREGALFGTPAYMSPEQAKGIDEVDHRTDLWALGCIVYECLTGKTVWNADQGVAMILAQIAGAPVPRPSRLRPDLPPTFDTWFQKALDRDPRKRFQDAKEFAESLAVALKPPPGSVKTVPTPSVEEGTIVDDLVQHSHANVGGAIEPIDLRGSAVPGGGAGVGGPHDTASDAKVVDSLPPPKMRSGGRAIVALLATAALAVGGYAAWLYVVHPPNVGELKAVAQPFEVVDDLEAMSRRPAEGDPFALQIGSAQERLARGESEDALTMFREAFQNGGHRAAQSLMYQAQVALSDEAQGPCRVTGLGRPRPFSVSVPVSRPSLVFTSVGPMVAWADAHEDRSKRRAFVTLLDEALRRVTPALGVTPEGTGVRLPMLFEAGERVALLYFDSDDKSPGVFARLLRRDGRIAGPARRLSEAKRHQFYPTLTAVDDGTFWAVWQEAIAAESEDLVARHLSSELEPIGDRIRLTDYEPTRGLETGATAPAATFAAGKLQIAYAFQRDTDHQIQLMRIAVDDPILESGIGDPDAAAAPKASTGGHQDRVAGEVIGLGPKSGKNRQAQVACNDEGCYVAWDDELAGAYVAYVEHGASEALWHRELASKGLRPSVARGADGGIVIVWYEASRVNLAPITRDGIGEPSVLARVSGFQPQPSIAPGATAGQWYISWRDYESGTHEAFIVRADCT